MESDQRSIYKCVRCGTCRSVCPVFEELGWESKNTRGRILVAKSIFDGEEVDRNGIDSLNTCTTCGICTENCPAGVNPPEIIQSVRKRLVSQGIMTKAQADLSRKVMTTGNVFGTSSDISQESLQGNSKGGSHDGLQGRLPARLGWLSDPSKSEKRTEKKADYVYFVGCLDSYRYPEVAAKTFQILSRFGVALLPDEQCCGSPLLRTGFDAGKFIDYNLEQIRASGAKAVVTGCAGCYTTLKNDYPKEFQVLSVPEFLAMHISELDIKPLDMKVTYHDPCHLGRHNGIYDPPRKVIKAICNLEEMKTNQENARCCGGGGGVRAGYGDLSLKIAKRRLKDVPKDAEFIVTTCPLCVRNLRDAGGKVLDLVELVAKAIEDNRQG